MPPRGRPPPEWEKSFFKAFRHSGEVGLAARAAGVHPRTVRRRRHDDPDFDAAVRLAGDDVIDDLLLSLYQAALAGSGPAARFYLETFRPEVWRRRPPKRFPPRARRRHAPPQPPPPATVEVTVTELPWPRPRARPGWEAPFLAALGDQGNVGAACTVAAVTRSGAYAKRRRDGAFAAAWDTALAPPPLPGLPRPHTPAEIRRVLRHIPRAEFSAPRFAEFGQF